MWLVVLDTMTVNSGEVKSAFWSDEKLNVEFKIPESDRTKTVKLEKHQVKTLISPSRFSWKTSTSVQRCCGAILY